MVMETGAEEKVMGARVMVKVVVVKVRVVTDLAAAVKGLAMAEVMALAERVSKRAAHRHSSRGTTSTALLLVLVC